MGKQKNKRVGNASSFIFKRNGENIMEEKIVVLYRKLRDISAGYLIYQRHDNIELVKKIIPQIQEFVLWFLEKNIFGIDEETYQAMCQKLLGILSDMLTAIEQGDRVLLHDAVTYGLEEYLELFIAEDEEEEYNDTV